MIANRNAAEPDIVLVGAGIMSTTLGTVLKELEPTLNIVLFETLHDCALESSEGWNNAGTGHAANCELNYTPQRPDGSVDISKALEVNTEFDLSRQLWSFLGYHGMEYSEDRSKIATWAPLIMDGRASPTLSLPYRAIAQMPPEPRPERASASSGSRHAPAARTGSSP